MDKPTLDSRDKPSRRRLPGARYRDALRRRRVRHSYRGDRVVCPCCEGRWERFVPDWNRPDAICPGCGAHERQRALWLYLDRRLDVRTRHARLLHVSPEYSLERRLRSLPRIDYISADIDPGRAEVAADIGALPFRPESFDLILCSHVLEHVEDDVGAMRELARVLAPGGTVLVMVPVDLSRGQTYEDPEVRTPQEREAAYWQADHVRLYGLDLEQRLAAGGLGVKRDRFVAGLSQATRVRHGLNERDDVYAATKPIAAPLRDESLAVREPLGD